MPALNSVIVPWSGIIGIKTTLSVNPGYKLSVPNLHPNLIIIQTCSLVFASRVTNIYSYKRIYNNSKTTANTLALFGLPDISLEASSLAQVSCTSCITE